MYSFADQTDQGACRAGTLATDLLTPSKKKKQRSVFVSSEHLVKDVTTRDPSITANAKAAKWMPPPIGDVTRSSNEYTYTSTFARAFPAGSAEGGRLGTAKTDEGNRTRALNPTERKPYRLYRKDEGIDPEQVCCEPRSYEIKKSSLTIDGPDRPYRLSRRLTLAFSQPTQPVGLR